MLDKIFQSVDVLPKIGDKTKAFLAKIGCRKLIDLIFYLPSNLIQIKQYPQIYKIQSGDVVLLDVVIDGWDEEKRSRYVRSKPFKIYCSNDSGKIHLVYFNYLPLYLLNNLKIGDRYFVSGKGERFGNIVQLAHPDFVTKDKTKIQEANEIVYPATLGLNSRQIRKYIFQSLEFLPIIEEWLPHDAVSKQRFLSFNEAIFKIHHPKNPSDLLPNSNPRKRLAFDEIFASQLAVNLMRIYKNKLKGRKFNFTGEFGKQVLDKLGFVLTNGQKKALEEIAQDQISGDRMIRLIQGDVGSGKTLVALIAMLNVLEIEMVQVCLMAPTDVLANQHFRWISSVLEGSDIQVSLLTGKIIGKKRAEIYQKLRSSEIRILLGTHAIFQSDVEFNDLGLIIIDEQHRFGVEQRASLYNKGNNADLISMTATPIPRTLTLALYGDMDLTQIKDKPAGRIPIHTTIMHVSKINEVVESLKKIIDTGQLVYWICPLIEETENSNGAAITRYNILTDIFGPKIGLVHGKLKSDEKEQVISDFSQGNYKILVATTVIEVGIDIKNANIIVIEQAEKFGLSQLHQLRGRVGRGTMKSYCILLYSDQISYIAKQKLKILKETNDGFILAEEDLKLRGAGDIVGTKQSGLPDFKFAEIALHSDFIVQANELARNVIEEDQKLSSPNGLALRKLLKIFGYHSDIFRQ